MRLFVYEWVTGGGFLGCEGAMPESLLREGAAMVRAVAADASACGLEVVTMRDLRLAAFGASGTVEEVDSRSTHDEAFRRLAAEADATLLVAPESDGVLLATVARAEAVGARLVSPGIDFVRVAADKAATAQRLGDAGTPVPEGRTLLPDEPLPIDFPYPAVIKPLDGAGSQDTYVVAGPHASPPAYAWARRIERYAPGVAASVGLVGVRGASPVALPACRQRLSADGRLRYLGGQTPLAPGLAERATRLALAAAEAMPPLVGYAGVDLVLGDDPNGTLDNVIEVNPRLTTSFVALRHVVEGGVTAAMLMAARGESPVIRCDTRPLAFDADGAVYWADP